MSFQKTATNLVDFEADFVVIGAGSAGAVVASRLADNPKNDVIVVEAGGSGRHPFLMVPGGAAFVKDWGRHAWLYQTEADPSRAGRSDAWRRGRSLGGSSSINGLIWARGLPRDFDLWQQAGAANWGWDHVLPYFKRAEQALGFEEGNRGHRGPIWVEKFRSPHILSLNLLRAFEEAGIALVDDINSAVGECASITQTNQLRGIRQSTETAYLRPRRNLKNLRTLKHAVVQRLIFNSSRAVGVEMRRPDGTIQRVSARKEIILSCGAIETPTLLMRSGIGDAATLRGLGIHVEAHSPDVGLHMQDHPDLYVEYAVDQSTYSDAARWHRTIPIGIEFLLRRRGPATSPGTHVFAYGRSKKSLKAPDLLIFSGPFGTITDGAFNAGGAIYSVTPSICHPKSRGHVRLTSAAATVSPIVQPNLLGDAEDLELIVDAISEIDRIVKHHPFGQHVRGRVSPAASIALTDRESLRDFAKESTHTCHHSCGTCRMGDDPNSVVDNRLRVRGVEGLRIADASVFPKITSGNLNAPVVMVGERAADLILEDHQL